MKIFLAGASGAIGRRLVPLLVNDGHHVIATTRSLDKLGGLRAVGTEPVRMDALDRDAVMKAVLSGRPDVIIHQATALTDMQSLKNFDRTFAVTNKLRTEGTEHLLSAARAAGTERLIVQSYAGWPNSRDRGRVTTENDPLDSDPPKAMRSSLDSIRRLEALVTSASPVTGIVLRYGSFYGPGTGFAPGGGIYELVRRRQFPVIGDGAGVWSFIHIDDAAQATRQAVTQAPTGIYNIVDDEPAEVSVWLPDFANAIGAKPPYRLPAWLGRFFAGDVGVSIMTKVRGSSNAKAKQSLNWTPAFATWRDGFHRGL